MVEWELQGTAIIDGRIKGKIAISTVTRRTSLTGITGAGLIVAIGNGFDGFGGVVTIGANGNVG
jgi:hypothetical protein